MIAIKHPYLSPFLLFSLVILVSSIAGCKSDEKATKVKVASAIYNVRGQVSFMPATGEAEIEIRHEAIPEFVNVRGKKTGMMSMRMSFGLADGLPMDGVVVGDKLAFTLDVSWGRKPKLLIKSLEKLPADTVLSFESKPEPLPTENVIVDAGQATMSREEMGKKTVEMFSEMLVISKAEVSDCAVVAAKLQAHVDANRSLLTEDKTRFQSEEDIKWFAETHGEHVTAVLKEMAIVLKECRDEPALLKMLMELR